MAGPVLRIAVRKFGPFEDAVRLQFADFCRSERIDATLEFDSLDLIPLRDALFGTGDGLRSGRYDVAFLNTDWLAEGVAEGKVRDLSLLMRERPVEGYPHGWSPSLSSLPHINGRVYGLPYHDGPMCLIYRNDLITQPPATWDDFRAASTRASDWAGGRYGTVVAGFADGHNTVYDFCIQVWTRGGELLDSTGRPSLDTSAAREGLAFYRSLLRDPATYPDAGKIDSVKSGELFMSGQVALMTNWFGFAAMCQTLDTSAVRGKIGIAPIPAGSGGRNASLNVYWFLSVAAGSTQP
ncbi:MAG TPA: extracellular solute-binding protein, partial [Tepidisphaeraceae bacterium]